MGISDELRELEQLRSSGALTDEEFHQAKQQALGGQPKTAFSSESNRIYGMTEDTWCMLLHLSQLLIFAGGVGIVVPIVMWAISKDDSRAAARHGARMMNWVISSFIYAAVSGVLCLFVIGIPMLIVLLVLEIAFPIMAALKAKDSILWSYPMVIRFIEED